MNSLLQEALLNTEHVRYAAIIRRKDGLVKAKSPGFSVGLPSGAALHILSSSLPMNSR